MIDHSYACQLLETLDNNNKKPEHIIMLVPLDSLTEHSSVPGI